jgi:integrase
MNTDLIVTNETDLTSAHQARIGQAANEVASQHVFSDYRSRKAPNTLRRQSAGLSLFADYLAEVGILIPPKDVRRPDPGNGERVGQRWEAWLSSQGQRLATDPNAWQPITWGLVDAFQKWQLQQGYAVSSVNVRISTIKTYAGLALKAGTLSKVEWAMIRAIRGYRGSESKHVDEQRAEIELPTRLSNKKADPVFLTKKQITKLKEQPDTPQGRRDRLLICLMLDLGLRVGEVASLTVKDFDLEEGRITFYREKVDKVQTHDLINGLLGAVKCYIEQDALAVGPLLRTSRKGGRLYDAGMSARNISERVRVLGERVGIEGLSAHDLRHTWATMAARNKTPIDRLQNAGGWSSPAMPLRYIEASKIANEGVNLG